MYRDRSYPRLLNSFFRVRVHVYISYENSNLFMFMFNNVHVCVHACPDKCIKDFSDCTLLKKLDVGEIYDSTQLFFDKIILYIIELFRGIEENNSCGFLFRVFYMCRVLPNPPWPDWLAPLLKPICKLTCPSLARSWSSVKVLSFFSAIFGPSLGPVNSGCFCV